ncbi:MAG: cytochrome c biogenesis protein [Acidimicrobiia bacterium]|nr:cytochrome c biogenesis protein [Acidimicrobiia bacterium]
MKRVQILLGLAAVGIATGGWLGLNAPPDALQGEYSRIINVHVPSSWLAFLAFGVTAFGSIAWLIRRKPKWDRLAASSAEIGVLFTGIALVTGMIWGHAVWGRAWDWGDPRLASTAVMFFVYLGYLALRATIDDPTVRARRSALLGAIAVVQVPLVYFSVNLWRSLHQTQSIRPDGSTMPDEMLRAMLINVIAFTILYVALLYARMGVAKAESEADQRGASAERVKPPLVDEVRDV